MNLFIRDHESIYHVITSLTFKAIFFDYYYDAKIMNLITKIVDELS